MGNWVNFAEVRARVSLADVLGLYDLKGLKPDGNKLIGPCPIHNGDSPRAFHADLEKNIWHCFSRCQRGGNQLDFVALKEGVSIREAALKLHALFLAGQVPVEGHARAGPISPAPPPAGPAPAAAEPPPSQPVGRNPPLSVELQLRYDHPHLIDVRGLSEETCRHFGVGYCSRGIMRGAIAIPAHDETGALVAYAGRRLKPDDIRTFGKYKLPKGFKKELVLYNLHRAAEAGSKRGLVLVEGFFSVMALYQAGFDHVVAAMGCELSAFQVHLLAAFPEVVLLFDGDEPGRTGALAAMARLEGKTLVRAIHLPEGVKPDTLPPRALKWLINGVQLLDLQEVRYQPRPKSA